MIANTRKAFNLKMGSLLGFLREQLEMDTLPDNETVVQRNFGQYIAQRQFNADQIRFLRSVQNVFLQKRHIELADLYDEPLDRFGEDAVERWFSEEQIQELLTTDVIAVWLSPRSVPSPTERRPQAAVWVRLLGSQEVSPEDPLANLAE